MKNQEAKYKEGVNKEISKFIDSMVHVERNLEVFKGLPITNVLNLEMPNLDILYILNLTFNEGNYSKEERNEFLEVARFGAICFQLAFTFSGDGFGLPLETICMMCNPEATKVLMSSHDGCNYMDDDMPFDVENILMDETDEHKIYDAINTMLSTQLAILDMGGDLPDFSTN